MPPKPKPKDPSLASPEPGQEARAHAVETLRVLRERLAAAPPQAIPRLATAITSTSKFLAKLDGNFEVTPWHILRSPHFSPICSVIVEAVRKFPGASAAVVKALRELEAKGAPK